jgi:LuxR family maltose regulon positive regulatory protein
MVETTGRAGRRLAPPPVPRGLLPRPRVLEALDGADHATVVCLQAPGGYGKTTVLAQWAAQDPRPFLWLSVRPAAADPYWLAQTLTGGLSGVGLVPEPVSLPGHVDPVTWHLHTLPAVEAAVSAVSDPFVVVIDDAGAMSGSPWESLVESLAVSLTEGSTLVIATREAVPATLWRLQTRGMVRVLGPDVLAFDDGEAEQLMELLGAPMPASRIRRLVRETQGWPVALYLVGRSAAARPPGGSTTDIAGLDEYLRADILGRLPPEDARFLQRVSVLTILDEQACEVLTGAPDALAVLRRLASENQLLAPQDDARTRFRMHPLLARFLSDHLHERDPQEWRAAHDTAGLVEERRGDVDGAVYHAKLAADDDRLSALIWSHTSEQLGFGQWAKVQRWLAGLDADRVRQHCGLALSAAWVALHSGEIPTMGRLALEASERSAHGEPTYRPDVDLLEATIGAEGLEDIESATRSFIGTRPDDDRWQSLALYLLGISLVLRDRTDEGVEALGQGYRRAEALDVPIIRAHCLSGLADVAVAKEERDQALQYVRELRALISTHRLEAVVTAAPLFTSSAVGYVLEGRYVDARHEAARALRLIAMMRDVAPWHAVQGRLALAQVNLALGDPGRAKVLLEEARGARGPANASPLLDRMFEDTELRLSHVTSGLVGTSSLTTAEVRVLQYLPTHLSFPQIAEDLVVSRHTVKTQAMSAYRKLGVHTRTEAIERAREAGLLPRG